MDIEKMLTDNKKLVHFVLHKQFTRFANDEDIVQVGMIGLWKACVLYDDSKGAFSTFAVYLIRLSILSELRNRKRHAIPTISLDAPVADDVISTIGDLLEDRTQDMRDSDVLFKVYLESLDGHKRKLVKLKMIGLSQEEIAQRAGISQSCVSKTLKEVKSGWMAM